MYQSSSYVCPWSKSNLDYPYLIFWSAKNTSFIRSGEGGASSFCVCRHAWATSPLIIIDYFKSYSETMASTITPPLPPKINFFKKILKFKLKKSKDKCLEEQKDSYEKNGPFLPRSPNSLYISLILDRLVPHASSNADVTKLPPMFSSCIILTDENPFC